MQRETGGDGQFRQKIKQAASVMEKIADKALMLLCFLIFGGLTYYSLRYTEILHEGTEIPWTIVDDMGRNLLALLIVTVSVFLIGRFKNSRIMTAGAGRSSVKLTLIIGAIAVCVAVVCIKWISICHVRPQADGDELCTAAMLMSIGNYDTMMPSMYMYEYPHQFSILAVIQILYHLFGIGNYQAFQYMNALCMPLLFWSGYKILRLICPKVEVVWYYSLLFISYIPMFLYVAYVYGEISSTCFAMVFMWQIIRYCKTGKKSCYLWGTIAIVFACMMRMNSIIILVAAGIVLLFHAFRAFKPQALIWLLVMFVAVFAVKDGIQAHYEKISGYEISDGIPPVSWVLMGLNDGPRGPGWYDGTNHDEFILHDYDTESTALDDKNKVMIRLEELWADKAYGIDFFRRKILTQWNAPACHSYFETKAFTCVPEELPEIVHRIYYEDESAINDFMDRYQFVLYFYVAIAVFFAFFSKKEEHGLENRILMIAIVGGFLFHILWEVMDRTLRFMLLYVLNMRPESFG